MELDDLDQPRRIGGLPLVIGRGQMVLRNGKYRQNKEKCGGDESRHR